MTMIYRTQSNTQVPKVRARSIYEIEKEATDLLKKFQPTMLERPESLDVTRLVSDFLPSINIEVCAVPDGELKEEGGIVLSSYPTVDILVRESQMTALHFPVGDLRYRVKATIAHEIGHAVLHAEQLKDGSAKLWDRSKLEPTEDPEWQAWWFARCLLMPLRSMKMLEELTLENVSDVFDVSPDIAHIRLKSLTRWGLI